jgi:Fe-S cluster assembly protein SufB
MGLMPSLRETLEKASETSVKFTAPLGLREDVVRKISEAKNEPSWMRERRLQALKLFNTTSLPTWGPSLERLDLAKIAFFVQPNTTESRSWDDVPQDIRDTFEKLGIPEAERAALGGVGAQFDSDMVYHNLKKELADRGVIFENMDVALIKHESLVRDYFMTRCVPPHDHPFAMLHAAVWSGGTFIYVPKGVTVEIPLQAYFRMNAKGGGQFEHTLIIADEGSDVHYIEGCSAPKYDEAALHAGCVEIFVKKSARVRYSSVENWSKNTFNLNTKRAIVEQDGTIEWLNGNLGSGTTMLYPMSILIGDRAKSDYLGIAFAGDDQVQDTGHKIAIVGKDCAATVRSKSVSAGSGASVYRGLVSIPAAGERASVRVQCDALLLDDGSVSDAIPVMDISAQDTVIAHEATVGRLSDEHMRYLAARGLAPQAAVRAMVAGFFDPVVQALPLEYAIELVRLIEIELERHESYG